MILSMYSQFLIFVLTIVLGFLTGLLYDFFRITRKIFNHPNFLIQIQDIIYWVLVTFFTFKLIIIKNRGEIRWFLILGLVIGMILYFVIVSDFVIKILMSVIHIIEKIITTVLSIIMFPIKIILKILALPFNFFKKKLKKISNKSDNILKKFKRYVKMRYKGFFKNIKIGLKKI